MPCYHPQDVIRSPRVCHARSGKPVVFFNKSRDRYSALWNSTPRHVEWYQPDRFQIPGCKPKCVGCQERYSRDWAVRSWHHSQKYDANCFITLTFNDEFVPRSLDHSVWQDFMKRFRRVVTPTCPFKEKALRDEWFRDFGVSFFMCGEYGSINMRPHFHACIYNFDFPDRKLWSVRDGVRLDTSEMLSELWSCPKSGKSFGFSSVGDVSFQSSAYIARYVAKKAQRVADASLDGRKPEYSKCSLKRPIGKDWFYSFMQSVYPDDAVTMEGGFRAKPPRYYDKLLELTDKDLSDTIRNIRVSKAKLSPDNTPARLAERESVKQVQFSQLKRGFL